MKLTYFYIPYKDDRRSEFASEYLKMSGYVETESEEKADFIILFPGAEKEKAEKYAEKIVFYGSGSFDKIYDRFFDYCKYEPFAIKNSALTAEGAFALYKQESKKAFADKKILISGYGRIAKRLTLLLKAAGSEVTVCCRSEKNKTEALLDGAEITDFESADFKKFDALFNTVPSVVFAKTEIDDFPCDMSYIELASFPGGIDKHYAKAKKINMIDGSRLPLRFSQKDAGILIGEAIDKMIKEGL